MPDSNPTAAALLAQPLTLPNGTVLKNRLAKSALSEALCGHDGRVTPQLIALYRRWSGSGAGLLVTGNVMIDGKALGEPGNVVIEDDRDLPRLREWAAAAKAHGSEIWMQINHPGKQAMRGLNEETVAPSAIGFGPKLSPYFAVPRALTVDEIDALIRRYGTTAAVAQQAGFTGVQLHGAHGYLINQFLSPQHNQRTDEWGGSAENRRRFVLAVYAEVRRRVGPDFPIGIKLNSADFQRGGFTEEESLDVIRALAEAGIDLIEISGGTYETPVMQLGDRKASTIAREAYFLAFAEKVRADVKVPLMVTGGFRSLAGMEAPLRDGALDLIGLGRILAIEPDAPARLLRGEETRHRVKPLSTGVKYFDSLGSLEVTWYTRQLHRIGKGRNPIPDENALKSFLLDLSSKGCAIFKARRLRASSSEASAARGGSATSVAGGPRHDAH
ncbi:NADH:flavin oxidoreductase/NADH oxidase family protein [Burkholderia pseudomallei]|uniref:NADH:flavin oxidoreductase/NADH oxidase family protein n=1 Tax=Burkholderia pseudomallei TaxID=28450 RepID=UPI00050DA10C|nr:NADH:flavin oxidoreductase/NADH oxidase family protein [Burkholderia pseudomallei]KGD46569.1 flavin oxidoreductase / NADH oxidase family protein [Burkholderia pseudomallei]KGS30559.1 flavin oxidoreductase / NADH oxidase family protein [Burkholderia pseudomallei MSHR5569]